MENNYTVYQHKNKINGKSYIGITKQNPIVRWRNGKGYDKNAHFSKAIEKYGWENFEHIILFTGLTQEEACQKEEELISLYDLTNPKKGYNISKGGIQVGPSRFEKMTEWQREHKKTGADSPIARKVRCKETNDVFGAIREAENWCGGAPHISDCCKGKRKYSGYHPETGYMLSWEYAEEDAEITIRCLEKQENKYNRSNGLQHKTIICLNTNEEFHSYAEAARKYAYYGATSNNISKACRGLRESAGKDPITKEKLKWAYIEEEQHNEGN